MKAIGILPSDPRTRQMNDAQWLWSYFNLVQDDNEEEEAWKARIDYLGFYVNYDMAKSVMEHEEQKKNNKSGVSYSEDGNQLVRTGVYNSSDFDMEAKAAAMGYDPESGLTPEEFVRNYHEQQNQNKDIDIVNDDFDALLNSGQFTVIAESDSSVGNRFESAEDFIARAQGFMTLEQFDQNFPNESDIPIGVESEEEWLEIQRQNSLLNNFLDDRDINEPLANVNVAYDDEKEAIRKALAEMGLTEDDLDIIEVPEQKDEKK